MKRTQTKWSWKDDYTMTVAAMDNSELYLWNKHFSNLNSNAASERVLEQALIVRAEIDRRELVMEQALAA